MGKNNRVTCRISDDDKDAVILTYKHLGKDVDGFPVEDIEIRVSVSSDTDELQVEIETQADSGVVAEVRDARDIVLRFDDVPNPFKSEDCDDQFISSKREGVFTPYDTNDDADTKCPDGECCVDDECCWCGIPRPDCHQHCNCYPDALCCDCGLRDEEW